MNMGSGNVVSANSQPTEDLDGNEALEIMVILAPGAPASISGGAVINTLTRVLNDLQKAGEDRFPFMRYATEQELKELAEADD